MSFTQTYSPSKTFNNQAASTSTILLSPRKRKRLSPDSESFLTEVETPREKSQGPKKSQPLRSKVVECRQDTNHSWTGLYKWTFSQAAVAPVRVKHVFEMDHEGNDHEEFYWMGRVPCRMVKIVGIVVGIDEYDDMTRFKLDDGTAVIDCDFKHPKPQKQPSTPKTKRTKTSSKYDPPKSSKPPSSKPEKEIVRIEIPKVSVGSILSAQGRIVLGRGTRYLRLEAGTFCVCKSANDEPRHWMEVLRLCREYYYLPEPFIIPKIEPPPETYNATSITPSSPITASSPAGTESSCSSTASPRRPRLRHPARLHSRDLTDVTFRIYLKHYMDFAPPYHPSQLDDEDDEASATECIDPFATPTPETRYKSYPSPFETPKCGKQSVRAQALDDNEDTIQYGFTLSYLRRVPVLAEMAQAVVHAEGKRREKEKRKCEKKDSSQRGQQLTSSTTSTSASKFATRGLSDPRQVSRNMKRLFQKTIRDLYKDGNIIIWNGPSRPYAHAFYVDGSSLGDYSGLWKNSSKGAPLPSTASTTRSSVYSSSRQDAGADGYLSDPNENEESYIPVTAQTIAPYVFRALCTLTGFRSTSRPGSRKHWRPTVDELTLHLQNSDAQWANLGSWDVEAALEYLQALDRVSKAKSGRWDVCS